MNIYRSGTRGWGDCIRELDAGWYRTTGDVGHVYDPSSGYEAVAYRRGNEIVIAFAGTDEPRDWAANLALAGVFWIAGGVGDDLLVGGAGLDTLTGGAGEEALQGGAGEDTLVMKGGSDGDTAGIGRHGAVERWTWRDGMVAGSYFICHIAAACRCQYPDGMHLRTGEKAGNDAWRLAA